MILVIRETAKVIQFTIIWALPVLLAKMFLSPSYLWFFAMSFVLTVLLFSHYEDIEASQIIKKYQEEVLTKYFKTEQDNQQKPVPHESK